MKDLRKRFRGALVGATVGLSVVACQVASAFKSQVTTFCIHNAANFGIAYMKAILRSHYCYGKMISLN